MTEADRFVARCKQALCHEIPALMNELFAKLDDALHDLADKSQSPHPRAAYLHALHIFSRQRHGILSLFLENLRDDVDLSRANQPPPRGELLPGVRGASGIDSIADAEPEEALALTNLISKAEIRYQSELTALRHHITSLQGQENIDNRADPLGPYHLCDAFRRALSPVDDIDLAIKLVAYKLFDRQVMDQLGDVYTHCCTCAVGQAPTTYAGPELVADRSSAQTTKYQNGRRANARASFAALEGLTASETAGPDGSAVFRALQRLLENREHLGTEASGGVVIDTLELIATLSRLQRTNGSEAPLRELRQHLSEDLHLGGKGSAKRERDRAKGDTLDLVLLLFEYLSQGHDIPKPLDALSKRFEIPTLKIALADKSFLDDKHHPTRRLLSHLAQVAVGWNDDGDRSPDSIYGRSHWVVDQVSACEKYDPALFAELDAELRALLAQEQVAVQSWGVQAQQEWQHDARQLVKAAIDVRLQSRGPAPKAVISLLYDGWQQVLLAAYRRDGTSGPQWQDAMATIDRLVWSVQPKVSYEDRRELLRSIPELLPTIRHSLSEISYDQRRMAQWFKELQALHTMALRGAGPAPTINDGRSRRTNQSADVGTDSLDGPTGSKTGAAASPPFGMETGTWIELRRDDSPLVRAKLAWHNPQSGVCLFLDPSGGKALEMNGNDILDLERQGTLTILGDTPVVDQAIQDLIQSLKDDQTT